MAINTDPEFLEYVASLVPEEKEHKWEFKDSIRDYWYVTAKWLRVEPSTTEEDFYFTTYSVNIKTGACCCGDYDVTFEVETQYNEPLYVGDIVSAFFERTMLFCDAALLAQGGQLGLGDVSQEYPLGTQPSEPTALRQYWWAIDIEDVSWAILAKFGNIEEAHFTPGRFHYNWNVDVGGEHKDGEYKVGLRVETPPNRAIVPSDIVREIRSHVMRFYYAAVQDEGIRMGRRD